MWYKAAYYQPSASGGDYWLYATASNNVPTIATANATGDISNPGANVANHTNGADWNGQDGNVTSVGSAGPLSESFYGTSDQGGNVWEWIDTVLFGSSRVVRGGTWGDGEFVMRSSFRSYGSPAGEDSLTGFRVASPAATRSADLDGDGRVDLSDFALFQVQFDGPE